jgi:hypothetical protein
MFSVGIETITDFDDSYVGFIFLVNTNERLSFGTFWDFRPYEKKVYVKSTAYKIRYLETRSVLGLLGKYLINPAASTQFAIEAGVTFSFAEYAGTAKEAESYTNPFAGLDIKLFSYYATSLNLGYRYLNISKDSDHHAKISINYGF